MDRLSLVAPSLATRLRSVDDPVVHRRAGVAAIEAVVAHSDAADPLVEQAVGALRTGLVDNGLRAAVQRLVEELDQNAWDLGDRVDTADATTSEHLAVFRQARLATAVSYACDLEAASAVLEVVYEAYCALTDGSLVLDAVDHSLR